MLTPYRFISILTLFSALTSCDPVHDLILENSTNKSVEVIYLPYLDSRQLGDKKAEKIEIHGQEMNKIILDSAETINIGTVTAMYTPSPHDIDLDYLEIRCGQDTIRLTGKNAILTTIQKVEKLDWRLIIK